MNSNIDFQKKKQRKICSIKRLALKRSIKFDNLIFDEFLCKKKWFQSSNIIASFLSIQSEISTILLNRFIENNKKILCLPVINNDNDLLEFKQYLNGNTLKVGKYGISEPINTKVCLPNIIFVPCLAYDKKGFRLGYGGGYYDKIISHFYSIEHNFISVGLAYDDQEVDNVIHDSLDQKINYILTEKRLYKFL